MLALYTVGAIVGLVLAGRYILNPLFRLVGRLGERELFVVAGLFAVIASAALMETLHLSIALGRLHRRRDARRIALPARARKRRRAVPLDPARPVLPVGRDADRFQRDRRAARCSSSGWRSAIIVVKAVLIAGLARLFGMKTGRAIWLGLLLSQAGEFGFVLFGQAAAAQLITARSGVAVRRDRHRVDGLDAVPDAAHRMGAATGCPSPTVDLDGPEFSPETNAIVVGYGRFGQTVAQMLMAKRIPVTIIDSKPAQIELSEEFGTKVYYGDGTRIDLLRTAGAETAEGDPVLPGRRRS